MRVVVGVTGASGAIYAHRVLRFLAEHATALQLEAHLVFTKMGRLVYEEEIGVDPASYGFPLWNPNDMTAPFASGSARFDAMVVVPCSSGQIGRIAHGLSTDLVGRTADVMLKERRPLLLVHRESPLSLVHLRNLVTVTEAGAVVLPASPSFYSHPSDVTELVDTVTSRILDHLGIDNALMPRWVGRLRAGAKS